MSRRSLLALVAAVALVAGVVVGYPYFEFARLWYGVTGIDVSHHQNKIDWQRVSKTDVAFAYIKATEGGDWIDKRFAENWQGAAAAGIARGAYHFFRQCKDGDVQAKNFIARVPKEAGALPPVVDVEDMDPCPTITATMDPVAEIEAFLDALERHYGCRPVIYTTPEYHAAFLANRLPNERFWVRSIHLPPMFRRDSWVLWQYHHAGRRDGVEGPLDLNVFRGSKEAFWRFAREAGCKG